MLGAAAPGIEIGARQLVNVLVAVCTTQEELPMVEEGGYTGKVVKQETKAFRRMVFGWL